MLTLDDIHKLPLNPTEDDLIAHNLLPPREPPPSLIPPVTNIPKPSPVKNPTGFRTGTGIGTLADNVDTSNAAPGSWIPRGLNALHTLPALSPVHPNFTPLPVAPGGPTGMEPASPMSPTGADSPLAGHNFPTLAPLNFKERQALPLSSDGVVSGSPQSALAELQRMEDQRANPWGSAENHPGTLGKIGHYAAKIGNIAGNIVAPATMANIEGTELNKQERERELKGEIAAGEKAEEAKKTGESERELRSAEAEEARARAAKLGGGNADIVQDAAGNAVGWRDDKGGLHGLDEEGTPANIKSIAEKWEGKSAAKPQKENLEQGLAGAVQEALDGGNDPKTDPKVQGWAQAIKDYKPSKDTDVKTVEDLKHRIVQAMESGDAAGAAQLQKELTATDPEGMARLADAQARMAATAQDRADKREDREEKQGLKWVSGEMPGTHQTVTVPLSQAKAMGLENQAEANSDHVGKVLAARTVVSMLYDKDPADPGVIQLIGQLDKAGELGVVASRWNDFMVRKVGADPTKDQLFTRLRNRLDLAQTKMMQAHVGNRGGAFMLDHFLSLAEVGKLDADTLRAGVDEELRYMHRLSEKPPAGSPSSGGGEAKTGGHNFSINGKHYENVPDDVYKKYKGKPGFKE